jgi:hypothetical protein
MRPLRELAATSFATTTGICRLATAFRGGSIGTLAPPATLETGSRRRPP